MMRPDKMQLREMGQSLRCIILPPAPQPLARRPQPVRPVLQQLSLRPQRRPRRISRLRRVLQRNLRLLQEVGVRRNDG
jgi:hypothetical protein